MYILVHTQMLILYFVFNIQNFDKYYNCIMQVLFFSVTVSATCILQYRYVSLIESSGIPIDNLICANKLQLTVNLLE